MLSGKQTLQNLFHSTKAKIPTKSGLKRYKQSLISRKLEMNNRPASSGAQNGRENCGLLAAGIYFGIISLLAYVTYNKVLSFTFYKDDWINLWAVKNNQLENFSAGWLHPGTTLEFIFLNKLLGEKIILWQHFGIILRVISSFFVYLMFKKLTKSSFVGFLAGVLFCTNLSGVETVSWVSVHVLNIAVIFLCLTVYFWLSLLEKFNSRKFFCFFLFLFFSIFSDPWRTIPIFLILFFLTFIKNPKRGKAIRKKFLLVSFFLVIISVFIFFFWHQQILNKTLLIKFLKNSISLPKELISNFYLLVNFFNSISNLFLGGLASLGDDGITFYNRFYGRVGALITIFAVFLIYFFFKKKTKFWGVISFFLLWIFLFYFPNFLYDPRLTLSPTHRYLTISSVCLSGLTAYLLSFLPRKSLALLISSFIIFLNVYSSNKVLKQQSFYRLKEKVDKVWETINEITPENEKSYFVYLGEEPLRTKVLALSGVAPFSLRRKISEASKFPQIIEDKSLINQALCYKGKIKKDNFLSKKIANFLSSTHIFFLSNNGEIIEIKNREQKEFKILCSYFNCKCTYFSPILFF